MSKTLANINMFVEGFRAGMKSPDAKMTKRRVLLILQELLRDLEEAEKKLVVKELTNRETELIGKALLDYPSTAYDPKDAHDALDLLRDKFSETQAAEALLVEEF